MVMQRSDVIRWDAARRALVIQRDRIEDVLVQRGSTWEPFQDQLDALGFTGQPEAPGVVVLATSTKMPTSVTSCS